MAEQRILVVDDDRDMLDLLAALLAGDGYTSVLCTTGDEAYRLACQHQPDLVMIDLRWGTDALAGWRLLLWLRAEPATTPIPALLYTANHDFLRSRQGALRLKRCATLEKPFHSDELYARINEALALPTST